MRRAFSGPPGDRTLAFAVAIALGLPAAGCSRGSAAAVEPPPAAAKIHVQTVTVTEQPVPKLLRLTGALSSNERTDLAANATGRVIKTFVERGDHVVQGAILAQLDARSASLSRAEAAANLTSASEQLKNLRADCQRYVGLLAKGAITQQEYDKQTTSCETQAASEEAARLRADQAVQTLTDSSIRAPFGGVIAERFVHVGDYVHPDTRVVTLLVDDPLRLELTVPEANVGSVRPGLAVSFETVAIPGRTFSATVKYMGGEIREATRDLVVEAVTDNPDHALLPGMFVTAQLPVGELTLPAVPVKAVVHRTDNNDSVFAVVAGHLEERVVQLGPIVGDRVAIADGVKTGESVVVSPPPGAVDGTQTE
ncbi:MAG: efflux RND transporter periplasmic adaptor subunit [Polyangiaceae bacterium]|jgi:membrane fusion protein (multidrug efflux system)